VLPNLSATAVVPGSWAYGPRGQPNEEADCDSDWAWVWAEFLFAQREFCL